MGMKGTIPLSWDERQRMREQWVSGEQPFEHWNAEDKNRSGWDEWRYWSYIENTKEQFDLEELIGLITKPHMLTVPDEIGMAVDSKDNLWITYRANDGAIYLARANDTLDDWVYHEQLLYVPSGSTYPTIAFDNDDRHVIAVEFLPAGSDQKEIWLYEPPYSGAGIRQIAQGQYPVLARDVHGEVFLFYQAADRKQILYRKSSNNFTVDYPFESSENEELQPRGLRTITEQISSIYQRYAHLMFYQEGEGELPRYKMTNYTMVFKNDEFTRATPSIGGLQWESYTFYVTIELRDYFKKTPIEGAVVIFRGQAYVTDAGGKIDLGLIGAYPSDTILIQHEDYPDTTFEFQITEDTDYIFEVLGALEATESLNASPVVTGIEWENMLKPLYLLVYSNWEDVPAYEINGMVVSNGRTTGNGLVWIEKGVSSNQDVQCDVWYETGEQARANILLRASVNMDSIDGYYCAYIDGFGIYMGKRVNGVSTWIGNVAKSVQPNRWYTARFSAEGSTLRYKIWERGTVEPSAWDLVVSDSSISEGYAGINGGHDDPERSCKWDNFILNGNLETFNTIENGSVSGWDILRDVSSVWHFEANEELVGYDRVYEIVPGATVQFGGQTSQTNQDGLAPFYELRAGDLHEYEITHPDYEVISTGKLLIPEGTDIVLPVQMFHDLPNYPCEVVSANPEVSLVEWVDARYTVTIRVVSYETGTAMAGASVTFAGETKITDGNGEAVFHSVKPFPTVNLYEIRIDEFPVANVRVTGHESAREITILIQAGAETAPKSVVDFAEMVPSIASILWVEVE